MKNEFPFAGKTRKIFMKYLKRIADEQLKLRLEAFGAVQIMGPKWCGKTTTAEKQAKSVIKMQNPDTRESYLATAQTKPSLLLKGETPRLIDEWQVAPVLGDAVRHAVDERRLKGQFILTGSTVIEDDEIMHTGTGRISKMPMYRLKWKALPFRLLTIMLKRWKSFSLLKT
mgnify:FL=1